jgi:hypothetical protein
MATIAGRAFHQAERPDVLSGTPRAHAIDRWIYVFTAVSFIAIVLVGFVPDSITKVAAVAAAKRPPFPLAMHVHAVLMGAFLLLLLARTVLAATGRCDLHRRLGLTAMVLAPALVVAGIVLAPTIYHSVWDAARSGPPELRAAMAARVPELDNILLLQIRAGLLFSFFLAIGLRARAQDPGFHKRMMILATAMPLPAAIDRILWLPTTLPASAIATDLYVALAVVPMFAWDVLRNRALHPAYQLWLPVYLAASIAVNLLWDTAWWHSAAHAIMRV